MGFQESCVGVGAVRLERQNRVGRPGCEEEKVHASFPKASRLWVRVVDQAVVRGALGNQ